MKKIKFIVLLQIICICSMIAQEVPKGMNYQAVARDVKGELIPNKKIGLKISLFSFEGIHHVNHYSETHEVSTNALGLFNLVVGQGLNITGEYGLIPWNSENIWMEVALRDEADKRFITISSSKLQAVPYAIHASTANKLIQNKNVETSNLLPPTPGVISTEWSVLGNAKTDASGNIFRPNALGTTDFVDLIMITDNVERLRILASGDIISKLNFEIGNNLTVKGNMDIRNTLTVGDSLIVKNHVLFNISSGNTINYGPFTVANLSPTHLTGILEVEEATTFNTTLMVKASVDLNSRLNVTKMSPTKLTGTLQVDKITDLNNALNVNNMSPTYFTGTLLTEKSTNLNDSLSVNNMSPVLFTGTLVVDKATDLNDSLSVNNMSPTHLTGTFKVEKEGYFLKEVLVSDSTQSISIGVGALVINGGLGIGRNFNVGGSSAFAGPVSFNNPVNVTDTTQSNSISAGAVKVTGGVGIRRNLNIGGTTGINGMTSLNDTAQSINVTTGSLKVTGGAGILKNVFVGGTTTIAGVTSITNTTPSANSSVGSLVVTGGTGIGLRLNVTGITMVEDTTQSTTPLTGALKVLGGTGIGQQLNVGGITSITDTSQSNTVSTGALKVSGGAGIGLQLNVQGITTLWNSTTSLNNSTGALKVSGGVGIGANLHIGQTMKVTGQTTLNGDLNVTGLLKVTTSGSFITNFVNSSNQNGIAIQVANAAPNKNNHFVEFRKNNKNVVGRIEGQNSTEYLSDRNYVRELAILDTRVYMAELILAQGLINVAMATAEVAAAASSATGCFGAGFCLAFPIPSSIIISSLKLGLRVALLIPIGIGLDIAHEKKQDLVNYKASTYGVSYESGAADYAEWLPKSDEHETFIAGHIVGVRNGFISKQIKKGDKLMVISTQPIALGNMPDKDNQLRYEKVAFLGQVPVQVLGKVHIGDCILASGNNDGMGKGISPSNLRAEDYDKVVGIAWTPSSDEYYNIINVAIGLYAGNLNKVIQEQDQLIQNLESEINSTNGVLAKMVPGFKEAMGIKNSEQVVNSTASTGNFKITGSNSLLMENNLYQFTSAQLSETLNLVEKMYIQNGGNLKANPYWDKLKNDPNLLKQFNNNLQSLRIH
ncbi:MAG: hypothetical protein ABI761_07695 [Saprospiraceae bacterium]